VRTMRFAANVCALAVVLAAAEPSRYQATERSVVGDRVERLTRESHWRLVASVPMKFRTYHPQGMVKIGETLFISSVEVKVPPKGYETPGEGIGHLFKTDLQGGLLADLRIGEGAMYHPGGIDADGSNLWVPVAEYRPGSRSILYKVSVATLEATGMLRVADHIGAVAVDTDDRTLHGVSWGSRRFYRWALDHHGRVTADPRGPVLNPSHYVDYQDCKYAGAHRMACTGVTEISQGTSRPPFRLGGLDLIDLRDGRPLHQVPVLLWTERGLDMTHNPVWLEPSANGLRAYFLPEDDSSTLFVYEVT
jgi:uncharacterized protein DUF6454